MKAITNLMRFTDKDPTFFPADSKAKLVNVQHTAVSKAASSPLWLAINISIKRKD